MVHQFCHEIYFIESNVTSSEMSKKFRAVFPLWGFTTVVQSYYHKFWETQFSAFSQMSVHEYILFTVICILFCYIILMHPNKYSFILRTGSPICLGSNAMLALFLMRGRIPFPVNIHEHSALINVQCTWTSCNPWPCMAMTIERADLSGCHLLWCKALP